MNKYNKEKSVGVDFDNLRPSNKVFVFCSRCDEEYFRRVFDIKDPYICRRCSWKSQEGKKASEESKIKRANTNIEKYGIDNPAKLESSKEKAKQTSLEQYGAEHISKCSAFKQIKEELTLAKYGVKHYTQTTEFKDKSKVTLQQKAGVNNAMQSAEVKQKLADTNIEKHGVDCVFKAENIKDKIKAYFQDKHGVDNPMQVPEIRAKAQKTLLEKYGSISLMNFYGKTQKEIQDWLNSLGFNFKSIVVDGKEIDLYDETLKLGIEYCGLYWHCEKNRKDKNYHNNKLKLAIERGFRLITIFEDEWLNRQSQVKNFLKSVIGTNKRVYARKCECRILPKKEACDFIEKHHIQGKNNLGKYFVGLYFENVLLSVMSFGLHPRNSNELVLDRLCTADGVSVVGGPSKMFNALLAHTAVSTISSWSDNRWSEGGVYKSLGFKLAATLPVDYSYVDLKTISRISKQSQKKSLTNCPKDMTESAWANKNQKYKIWDCGKTRWVYDRPGSYSETKS